MKWLNILSNTLVLIFVNLLSIKEYLEISLIFLSIILTATNLFLSIKKIRTKKND